MSIALDIGASRLRSLRRDAGRLIGRSCRSRYAVLADGGAQRELLRQVGVPYAVCEDGLVLMGDAAAEYARLFRVPSVPLLPGGRVPQADPPARQALASLVESLLPGPRQPGDVCVLTAPSAGESPAGRRAASRGRDLDFLTRLVRLRGYAPIALSAGTAVVLAEMVSESFTGIGVALGASSGEFGLTHCGIELARCSVPHGGDWIDERLARIEQEYAWDSAGNRYLDTAAIAAWKESWTGSLLEPRSDRERRLAELYEGLVSHIADRAAEEFARRPEIAKLPQPLAVVVSGAAARVGGFGELFERALRAVGLPVEIKSVRIAAESDYTIARGCLIKAELESQATDPQPLAA